MATCRWSGVSDPPVYPKQLGVAFFVFVAGYTLARETRPRREVVFKRLFEIYLFGVLIALAVSAINYVRIGDVNGSNYLPFLLGINVVLNNFPANPTTWFIGTFIHLILIWAFLLRGLRIQPWMLAAVAIAEILLRATLVATAGRFVAYMVFPNWSTAFLLGLFSGSGTSWRRNEDRCPIYSHPPALLSLGGRSSARECPPIRFRS